VEEYGMHPERHYRIELATEVAPALWYDWLKPSTAAVLGTWQGGHLTDGAAVTRNAWGRGACIYVGTFLAPETAGWIADLALKEARVQPILFDAPAAVEVVLRRSDERSLIFLLNHDEVAHTIAGAPRGLELLRNAPVADSLTLAARQVAIIELGD
jgi:beta-galactosidase